MQFWRYHGDGRLIQFKECNWRVRRNSLSVKMSDVVLHIVHIVHGKLLQAAVGLEQRPQWTALEPGSWAAAVFVPPVSPGPFHTPGIPPLHHTINMDGRDEFTEDSECCSNNSQEVQEQDSISGTGWGRRGGWGCAGTSRDCGLVSESKALLCALVVCLSVLIGLCLPP